MPLTTDNLPAQVRNKLTRLQSLGVDPNAYERIKERVKQRALRMNAKKARELGQAGRRESAETERLKQRKAAEVLRNAPEREPHEMNEWPHRWSRPAMNIPKVIQFSPRPPGELVDIPLDFKEGVKQEIINRYGIPPDEADVIASNAVDRWVDLQQPSPARTPLKEARIISGATVPAFSVETLPGALGEIPDAMQSIQSSYVAAGWKTIIPLALVGTVLILWLRR